MCLRSLRWVLGLLGCLTAVAQTVVYTLPTGHPAEILDVGTTDGLPLLNNVWWAERLGDIFEIQERRSFLSPERGESDRSSVIPHQQSARFLRESAVLRDTTYYYFVESDVLLGTSRVVRKPVSAASLADAMPFFVPPEGTRVRALARDGMWLYAALSVDSAGSHAWVLQRIQVATGKSENLVLGNPPGVSDFRVKKLRVGPVLRPSAWGAVPRTGAVLLDEFGVLRFLDPTDPTSLRTLDTGVSDFEWATMTLLQRTGGDVGGQFPVTQSVAFTVKQNSTLGRDSIHRQSLDDFSVRPLPILGDASEPQPTALVSDEHHLFVAVQGDGNFRIFRYEFPNEAGLGGAWGLVAAAQPGPIQRMASSGRRLYFATPVDLRRLDADAPAIVFQARALALEVVQAVQNLDHEVPLVVGKPTLVRAYATIPTNTLPNATWFPTAELRGFRDGVELPGSPLSPNAVHPVPLETAAPGATEEQTLAGLRGELEHSFNFDLPPEWVDRAGSVTFRFVLDPSNSLPESPIGRGHSPAEDNRLEITRPLVRGGHPTLVFVPLRCARGPDYVPGLNGYPQSDFDRILSRARSLLPVEDFDVRFQPGVVFKKQVVLDPLPRLDNTVFSFGSPSFGISDLDGELVEESQWALLYTALFALMSPRVEGADVHWVGAVAPMEPGFNGVGGVPGLKVGDLSSKLPWWLRLVLSGVAVPATPLDSTVVVRMSSANESSAQNPWNDARGGFGLAHELGHNYGRLHVDQSGTCKGQRPEGPYSVYPYASGPCTIGSAGISTGRDFVGYDPVRRVLVPPDQAGDLMSYRDTRWVSPFTWNATLSVSSAQAGHPATPFARASVRPALNPQPLPPKVMAVAGVLTPDGWGGALLSSQILASEVVDARVAGLSLVAQSEVPPEWPLRLRQLDASGRVLSEQPLQVLFGGDDAAADGGFPFVQVVVPEEGLGSVALVGRDGVVIAQRTVSAGDPAVSVEVPELDGDRGTLHVRWKASDPDGDALTFAVQFSPDDGVQWQLLDPLVAATELTVPLDGLPGGARCRIRVTASDGIRTALAESAPFELPNRAPRVSITGILSGETVPFGDGRWLSGLALDNEDGVLEASALRWSLEGAERREGSGAGFSLQGLPPGRYSVSVSALDSGGVLGTDLVPFTVGPMTIPDASVPPLLDGFANDEAYRSAAILRVKLAEGRWSEARLVRSGGSLYVGFADLPFAAAGAAPTRVGLVLNPGAERHASPRATDRGFYVDEGGVPYQTAGDGTRLSETGDFQYGFTAQVAPGAGAWSAEFRIEESLLGGPEQAVGLAVDLVREIEGRTVFATWPAGSNAVSPESWGDARTGDHPPVPPNLPPVARTGPPMPLELSAEQSVFLSGLGSFDPEGRPLEYSWSQISGPAVRWIIHDQAVAEFVASPVAVATPLGFALRVSDGELDSAPAETQVLLLPPPARNGNGHPASGELGDDGFRTSLAAAGRPGDRLVVEASTNLVDWEFLATTSLDWSAGIQVRDPDVKQFPRRFFRAVAGAPSEEPNYPDGLISLWRGEGDASDALGSNPGAVVGEVSFGPGRLGRAFHFDGRGRGIIRIPDSPTLRPASFTVCAWVQLETDPLTGGFAPGNMVFGKALASLPGHSAVALRATPSPGILGYLTKPQPPASSASVSQQHWWSANTNTWYHLAMTVQGRQVTLYLNGVRLPAQAPGIDDAEFPFYDEGAVSIGGAGFTSGPGVFADGFRGAVDEVALFGRVLGDAELAQIVGFHPIEDPPTPGTILFSRADGTIWALSPGEGVPRFVTVGTQPILSPDRTRLLLRRLDGSPGGVILMRDLASGREVPLYLNGTFCQGFSWFPDGGSVALDDFNLGPSLQGFRSINSVDGSDARTLLVRNPYDAVPVISPDGSRLLFHNFSVNAVDQGGIYSGELFGGAVAAAVRFPNTAYGDSWPSWSPEGTHISFSDRVNLFVMRSDGSLRTSITQLARSGDGFHSKAPFEPGGRTVVATGVVDGVRGLYRIPVDGSSLPELLLPLPKLETGSVNPEEGVGSVAW
ncbi:MAG: LamG-like jellyroll fold domain-containing protein [Verrucomicrobiota bacterium]